VGLQTGRANEGISDLIMSILRGNLLTWVFIAGGRCHHADSIRVEGIYHDVLSRSSLDTSICTHISSGLKEA
jgi:hypothetical protein